MYVCMYVVKPGVCPRYEYDTCVDVSRPQPSKTRVGDQ